jgi:hypothetical protein
MESPLLHEHPAALLVLMQSHLLNENPATLLVLHERPTIPHTNEVLTMFPKLLPYDFSVFQKFLFLIVPRSINEKKSF